MVPTDPAAQVSTPHSRVQVWFAGALVGAAAVLAYANAFSVPFQLDDPASIMENPSIRHLWPLIGPSTPLCPPTGGLTVSGRPLVNLSLALNYAFGTYSVRGYHLFNLAIHVLAGLALFGLLRRTFLRVSRENGYEAPWQRGKIATAAALPLALAIATLWVVHPLQTEAVTYIVQRAESMMGLFYLLTLYAFARAVDAEEEAKAGARLRVSHRGWLGLSVAACLAGMATKEVMVSAPLLVLLYDRTFVAGSFGAAWRSRWRYYLPLAATWLLLGWLVVLTGNRNATAGLNTPISPYIYALTQCRALAIYLKLSVWPYPQVFDYGSDTVHSLREVWLSGVVILAVLGGVVYAIWRRSWLGVAGAWCFAILAPTSSIVPIATQTMAEHRMYLPLAGVLTAAGVGAYVLLGRWGLHAIRVVTVVFAALTVHRNVIFQSELTLWRDVLAKRPDNYRAYNDLGFSFSIRGHIGEAIEYYQKALALNPVFTDAHNNLGYSYYMLDRLPEAVEQFQFVLRISPLDPHANMNLANSFMRLGRVEEAARLYRIALLNDPGALAHGYLALALVSLGRPAEAVPEYEISLKIEPDSATAWSGLGYAYALVGRPNDAIVACHRALDLAPTLPEAHNHLGIALTQLGRNEEAIAEYKEALRLKPALAEAHNNLGNVLLTAGRIDEAIAHYEHALQDKPDYADAEFNLGEALRRAGHPEAAAAHFETAKRLRGER